MTHLGLDGRLFIDGHWIPAASRDRFPIVNPATEEEIGRAPIATAGDLDRALESAGNGFNVWSGTSPAHRSRVLLRVADILTERKSRIAATLTLEEGKVETEARGEVDVAAALFRWYAGEAVRVHGRVARASDADVDLHVLPEPVGPAAIFTPWNFPLIEPAAHIAAALAAGCPVVVKVSEETPLTGAHLFEAMHDAELPRGVAQLVTGSPEMISDHLIRSRVIRKVAFTGSTAVGRELASKAAAHLKTSIMELGGNAPAVVFADSSVQDAAAKLARAKCRNSGQVCTVPNRIFVQEEIFDAFAAEYTRVLLEKRIGPASNPASEMGPLTTARGLARMDALISEAMDSGGAVACGGKRLPARGYFYDNTVLLDPPEDSAVVRQEIFGPISPLLRFSTTEEVIERANDTNAGLAGYVFSGDPDHAQHVASAIEAGSVAINHTSVMFAEAPFGGLKDSGFGRIGGREGLMDYLVPRLISTVRSQPAPEGRSSGRDHAEQATASLYTVVRH